MKELEKLQASAFRIRRKIDQIEQGKVELINEYNKLVTEISKLEGGEKGQNEKQ